VKHRFAIAEPATFGAPRMPGFDLDARPITQRQRALQRWENEGGAIPGRRLDNHAVADATKPPPAAEPLPAEREA